MNLRTFKGERMHEVFGSSRRARQFAKEVRLGGGIITISNRQVDTDGDIGIPAPQSVVNVAGGYIADKSKLELAPFAGLAWRLNSGIELTTTSKADPYVGSLYKKLADWVIVSSPLLAAEVTPALVEEFTHSQNFSRFELPKAVAFTTFMALAPEHTPVRVALEIAREETNVRHFGEPADTTIEDSIPEHLRDIAA